jgi:hypothetical protein
MKYESPDKTLFDDCFRILTETEEVLTRARDVFQGLADGRRSLTSEEAAGIATVLERSRTAAAARVRDYRRLHAGTRIH